VIREQPDLGKMGRAGMRLKLERMLLSVEGVPRQEWEKLNDEEREVLRQIARVPDLQWGVTHQADAIGALAALHDQGALLQLSQLALDERVDMRLQIAATHALGEIGGEAVRPSLLKLLSARRPEVRAQAAQAMAKVGTAADVVMLDSVAQSDKSFAGQVAGKAAASLRTRLALR
jgi:HEAT repeat protein